MSEIELTKEEAQAAAFASFLLEEHASGHSRFAQKQAFERDTKSASKATVGMMVRNTFVNSDERDKTVQPKYLFVEEIDRYVLLAVRGLKAAGWRGILGLIRAMRDGNSGITVTYDNEALQRQVCARLPALLKHGLLYRVRALETEVKNPEWIYCISDRGHEYLFETMGQIGCEEPYAALRTSPMWRRDALMADIAVRLGYLGKLIMVDPAYGERSRDKSFFEKFGNKLTASDITLLFAPSDPFQVPEGAFRSAAAWSSYRRLAILSYPSESNLYTLEGVNILRRQEFVLFTVVQALRNNLTTRVLVVCEDKAGIESMVQRLSHYTDRNDTEVDAFRQRHCERVYYTTDSIMNFVTDTGEERGRPKANLGLIKYATLSDGSIRPVVEIKERLWE